jgi:protein-tyrosine kinase
MSKLKKALEKAREARRVERGPAVEEDRFPSTGTAAPGHAPKSRRSEVHVTFSETEVIDCRPKTLRKNKVVSLCHESEITDQLKILRTQVLNKLNEAGGNSLLITSANRGEGKTFTSINLAVSLSHELDRTVLLVDADLRNASVHRYFGLEPRRGLSDCLLRRAEIPDVLFNPGIKKLTVLPGGKPLPNAAELLGSARMESLVLEMKSRYLQDRIVIFDSSSLLVCTDPAVFSHLVDGILVVVEMEKTTPDDLSRAMELLKDRPIWGTVLNKAL